MPPARWLVLAAAAGLPLAVSPATADTYFLPKLVAARVVVIALLLMVGLAAVRGRFRFRATPLDIPLGIFVASSFTSTAFSVNRNLSFFGSYGRYEGFLTVLLYALLFWLTVQSFERPKEATTMLRTLLGAAYVVSILTVLQVAIGSLNGAGPAESGFSFGGVLRGYATFGSPDALGAFLAMRCYPSLPGNCSLLALGRAECWQRTSSSSWPWRLSSPSAVRHGWAPLA